MYTDKRIAIKFDEFAYNNLKIIDEQYKKLLMWIYNSQWIDKTNIETLLNITWAWIISMVDKYTDYKILDNRYPPYIPIINIGD